MIKVEAKKAYDYPSDVMMFLKGHQDVLKSFDISNITSNSTDWAQDPLTVMVLIKNNEKLIGGARIQVAGQNNILPLQEAIYDMDNSINDVIDSYSLNGGTVEFCGLWNTMEAARLGIGSVFMMKAGLSVVSQMSATSLFVLCAPATVENAKRMGARVATWLGDNGTFYYPKLDLIATLMIVEDVASLSETELEFKRSILDLRETPNIVCDEIGRKNTLIKVNYELTFD